MSFKDKGIILLSSIDPGLKIIIAGFEDPNTSQLRLLIKPVARRRKKSKDGSYGVSLETYRSWFNPSQALALSHMLMKAVAIIDDFQEGTVELTHLLSEDEDARNLVSSEVYKPRALEDIFILPIEPHKKD